MQEERNDSSHAMFRGIILLGFFLLVFRLLVSGDIRYYIAPKMIPFSYVALVILLALGVMQLWRISAKNPDELHCNCGFDHNPTRSPFQTFFIYALFVLPVLTGLWFPPAVLDSSIVVNRGIKYGAGLYAMPAEPTSNSMSAFSEEDLEEIDAMREAERDALKAELVNSEKIIVDDERYLDIMSALIASPDLYSGKEIEIIGFVYKEPEFDQNQLVIARFSVTCCIADAVVLGLLASADDHPNLKEDQWVKATGHLSKTTFNGLHTPSLLITEIEEIEQPEYPYVY
ncbi:TIGR03943 family protein [Sporosarcina sp. ACRSM]|uniref:TIGR03943 family putative permease subunit n=1 Tax=Sporosarcina sp. ACRSM TaxID=2918216 RepID=UPI001EF5CA26|nr:TIGR03943 family protein [Sporosarcina sp. ACRSM]MCG7337584.1 TIGR03943 family protein [Sporosarcina sp. ACRSM]